MCVCALFQTDIIATDKPSNMLLAEVLHLLEYLGTCGVNTTVAEFLCFSPLQPPINAIHTDTNTHIRTRTRACMHASTCFALLCFALAFGPGPPLVKWAIIGLHLGEGGPLKACRPHS